MCGIAGAVGFPTTDLEPQVERQLRTLDHRGPDSWGIFGKRQAAIGQTRLSIIDLVTGDPPITDEKGAIGAVLNGEIYNYADIRAELMQSGHTLSSTGDTEVIAHLAESLEPADLATRLEGMFAFAVLDDHRGRLILGRDRLGKKPLYYWTEGKRFVFGSEIKAVLSHPAVSRELDPDAIPAYLTFGYVPTPRTFFAGVRSVPPGHVLTFDIAGAISIEPYWQPAVPGSNGVGALDVSFAEATGELRRLLTAAVRRRLVADVPLGAFLSGGIDSSTIVGLMAEVSDRPVRTFTIGFEDQQGFDERPYAKMVAERFGTDHTEFVVNPDALDLIERLVWHHDQPFGDSSAIPTYLLSELTRGSVTVALCGDGGDEIFAGYERFAAALALTRLQQVPHTILRPIGAAAALIPAGARRGRLASVRRFMERAELDVFDAYLSWMSYFQPDRHSQLVGAGHDWGVTDYRRIWDSAGSADLLDRLLLLNLRTYLLDDLLPKVDRMSMAHGLEVRAPFLDRELVEFSLRLPASARLRGWNKKRVLKAAAKDLLPYKIVHRRKQGFGVPLDRWFRTDLRSYLQGTLGSASARIRAHVDGDTLDRVLAEHDGEQANHGLALWSLLTLEVFLQREGW